MSATDSAPSTLRRWLSTLPILVVLFAVLVQWTGSQLQSKVIQAGEGVWPGYGSELRREPVQPTAPEPPEQTPTATERVDQDLIGDLLGDDTPANETEGVDQDLIGDLLGDLDSQPSSGIDEDLIGDLLGEPTVDPDAQTPAQARYERQLESYEREQARVASILERRTEGVQRFSAVDLGLESFVGWGGVGWLAARP